jgi:hypothetical protein
MRPTASSWMKFNCGDHVCTHDDPRHVGRIDYIDWSHTAKVRWLDNGFISHVPLSDLTLVSKAQTEHGASMPTRPRTVTMSPRRQLEIYLAGGAT